MPTVVDCPACSRQLRVPDDLFGRLVKCPTCGETFTAELPVPEAPPPVPEPVVALPLLPDDASEDEPAPRRRRRRRDDYEDDDDRPRRRRRVESDARDKVSGPAIALIVTAVLGIIIQGVQIVLGIVQVGIVAGQRVNHQNPMNPMETMLSGPVMVGTHVLGLGVGIAILAGAIKMKNLRAHGFAMTAAVLALIPCISPCCLLGLPFGIWALTVLNDPDVRDAFE